MLAEAQDPVIAALLQYFDGERRELLAIVAGSLAAVAASAWLYANASDGFARGLLATVVACAVLLSAMAGSLLVRDAGLRTTLAAAAAAGEARPLDGERARIAGVVSKYRHYRYAALLVGVAALALLLTARPALHGVAAGLLLLVAAQAAIDHYSERRARGYADALALQRPA